MSRIFSKWGRSLHLFFLFALQLLIEVEAVDQTTLWADRSWKLSLWFREPLACTSVLGLLGSRGWWNQWWVIFFSPQICLFFWFMSFLSPLFPELSRGSGCIYFGNVISLRPQRSSSSALLLFPRSGASQDKFHTMKEVNRSYTLKNKCRNQVNLENGGLNKADHLPQHLSRPSI